jgi:hypothetical protein
MQDNVNPGLRRGPGGLRPGETAADDVNGHCHRRVVRPVEGARKVSQERVSLVDQDEAPRLDLGSGRGKGTAP